jgi:hypothetical protein
MTPTHVSPREREAACLIVRRSVNRTCIITTQQKTWLQVLEYVRKLGALQARILKTQVLRAKYRDLETQVLQGTGPETQVLRAKCNNTRVYCTSLCKNTAVVRPFYLFEVT